METREKVLEELNQSLPSYVSEKIKYASDTSFSNDQKMLTKLKEMKKIAEDTYFQVEFLGTDYAKIRNWIFIQQAKFMVDVEDDYSQVISPVFFYSWNYDSLRVPELRTYFTWRSKIRKGEYPKIFSGYLLIYFAELINLIGADSVLDAYSKLKKILEVYWNDIEEVYFRQILVIALKDFMVNYAIPVSYNDILPRLLSTTDWETYQARIKIVQGDYRGLLTYLDKQASYKVKKSKFYESTYGYFIEEAIPTVFEHLSRYFAEHNADFKALVLGKMHTISDYPLFRQLPYVEQRENYENKIDFSPIEQYTFQKKICNKKMFMESPNLRVVVGIILKMVEIRIREKTNYKRKLTLTLKDLGKISVQRKVLLPLVEDDAFIETIVKAVDLFLDEKMKQLKEEALIKRRQSVVIDKDSFQNIRESTVRIQEKILTEEEKTDTSIQLEPSSSPSTLESASSLIPEQDSELEMGMDILVDHLTSFEKKILNNIINGASRNELETIVKEEAQLLEVVLEDINLKALDYIGDNLIEDLGDQVNIYEDYWKELQIVLHSGKEKN